MPLQFARTSSGLTVPIQADASGRVSVDLHGFYSGSWRSAPIPFGLSSGLIKRYSNTALSAGTNTLNADVIPNGEAWIVTNITITYIGTSPTLIAAALTDGASSPTIYAQASPVSASGYDRQGQWIGLPGYKFQGFVFGATLNDAFYMDLIGYAMDLDL